MEAREGRQKERGDGSDGEADWSNHSVGEKLLVASGESFHRPGITSPYMNDVISFFLEWLESV